MPGPPHRITEVDTKTSQGHCSVCGPTVVVYRNRLINGRINWRCRESKRRGDRVDPDNPKYPPVPGLSRAYRKRVKDHCEHCGFVPLIPMQLDVDHIDGNPRNHAKENLQTLCANCHRLKTYIQRFPERARALGLTW